MEKFCFLFLIIFLQGAFSVPPEGPQYVHGGKEVAPREFPHLVAVGFVKQFKKLWLCGGTLITERFVLTAAHCLEDKDRRKYGKAVLVRLGDLDLKNESDNANAQEISVIQRIPHPKYAFPMKYHDIGLLKLKEAAIFNKFVQPACLHKTHDIIGTQADVLGWGETEKGTAAPGKKLYKALIDLQSIDKCTEVANKNYNITVRMMYLSESLMDDSMICAGVLSGGKDSCNGDSGGPLQINSTQPNCSAEVVGIVSFGLGECAAPNTPAVYVRVSNYVPWIESVINNSSN